MLLQSNKCSLSTLSERGLNRGYFRTEVSPDKPRVGVGGFVGSVSHAVFTTATISRFGGAQCTLSYDPQFRSIRHQQEFFQPTKRSNVVLLSGREIRPAGIRQGDSSLPRSL